MEWIQDNLILVIVGAVAFTAVEAGTIIYFIKQNKKQARAEIKAELSQGRSDTSDPSESIFQEKEPKKKKSSVIDRY